MIFVIEDEHLSRAGGNEHKLWENQTLFSPAKPHKSSKSSPFLSIWLHDMNYGYHAKENMPIYIYILVSFLSILSWFRPSKRDFTTILNWN